MRIVLASNNEHKLLEFGQIDTSVEFVSPASLGIPTGLAWEETGATFFENALGKAKFIHEQIVAGTGKSLPVLADDSGLCVAALDGRPGIYSARYGEGATPPATNDSQRNALLLREMEGESDRRAHYVCALLVYLGTDAWLASQSIWEGQVALQPSAGGTGFGYDPIIIVQPWGLTVSQISKEEKARHSHRALAWAALKPALAQNVLLQASSGR